MEERCFYCHNPKKEMVNIEGTIVCFDCSLRLAMAIAHFALIKFFAKKIQ